MLRCIHRPKGDKPIGTDCWIPAVLDQRKKLLEVYLPVGTALVSTFSFFCAWIVALDSRLDSLENQLFRVYSVVVSAQSTGSYCNIDIEKFLETIENEP